MMEFFTSPEDLRGWVKIQESPDQAANKIMEIIGADEEQDVVDTCRAIFNEEADAAENASKILFGVLAKHNITQIREGEMKNDKMKREAQGIYRGEAALYQSMPLRVCPKLPAQSNINPASKRVISTIHCREHCLDSFTFDDDPLRVYCAEALWRRHVMDKFSREWRNDDGKLVGGYINERFQVYHEDGGNPMALAKDERVRLPRPHQYSTERRLEEARGEKTYDITASSDKIVKVASNESMKNENDDQIYQMFSDIIEMKEAGISDEDVLYKVAEHYNTSIFNVAKIQKVASKQLKRHDGTVYASHKGEVVKKSQALPQNSTMVTKADVEVINLANGQPTQLKMETPVVMVSNDPASGPLFEIVDGPDAGSRFKLSNNNDMNAVLGMVEDIQTGADEVGLNDEPQAPAATEEFPIVEE
jgi:hypothetical protein